jgi:hypothetical protein
VTSPLDRAVSDGVNGAMKGEEPAGREATLDRPASQAEREQLPPGNHSVLPGSQIGDDQIRGSVLFTTV